ncbi:VPLPA-CTERM sorting domain-containing protein [Frigidibacter sp. MR17.14]|uniref:VPLPA-CTERM sorting domain-containing protein n=1 Tax=Frigidibacter sp. MR17.14 TaxID=3126509 RepID=UPI003012F8D4
MNLRVAGVIAALSTTAFAGQAFAATVVLDSFTIAQQAVDVPYAGVTSTSTIAFGPGQRTLTAENTGGPSPVAATELESVDGTLSFSNKDRATGKATLTYTNLGDIDLGDNPYFYFDVGYFDATALFSVEATDTFGMTSTYSEQLTAGFNPYLYFSQFTGDADFNSIATLSFMLDTGAVISVDGSLNEISYGATPAPVPLPAAGLLLLAGVGGLGGLRAMRRKKA